MGATKETTFWEYRAKDLISPIQDKINRGFGNMKNATQKFENGFGNSFKSLAGRVSKFRTQNLSAISDISSEMPMLGNAVSLLTNPYMALGVAAAGAGTAMYKATNMAMTFEKGMAKVNATAQLAPPELAKLKNQLIDMGSNSTTDLEQIPDAFNVILSAVGDTKKSLEIFQPALKAAQAGFTDIKTVAEAATNVLGAVKGATPNEVFDVLFATLNKGKAEFADIANYLPKIIPYSNNLGLSFKETAGAFAYFTANGNTVEATTMLLQNAFTALANPKRIEGFKRIGVSIFDAQGKMKPMADIMDNLSQKLTGLTDEQRIKKLSSIGLDAQAASAFSIATKNTAQLREMIDATTNSSGEMNKTLFMTANTIDTLAILKNKLMAQFLRFGDYILGYGKNIAYFFKDLYDKSALFRDGLSLIWEIAKKVFSTMNIGVRLVWNAFSGLVSIVSYLGEKLGISGSGIEKFYLKARPYLKSMLEIVGALVDGYISLITMDFSGVKDNLGKAIDGFKNFGETQKEPGFAKINSPAPLPGWTDNKLFAPAPIKPVGLVPVGDNGQPPLDDKTLSSDDTLKDVASGGKQVRNVNVRFDNLVKELIINTTNLEQGMGDVKKIVEETFIRLIRDSELAVG
jgi:TP901 family phage tail tape measure protein